MNSRFLLVNFSDLQNLLRRSVLCDGRDKTMEYKS